MVTTKRHDADRVWTGKQRKADPKTDDWLDGS
jgi:hypothetical protein